MFKHLFPLLLVLMLLAGCAFPGSRQVYQVTWLDVFDTVTTLRGYAGSQTQFQETAAKVHDRLVQLHQLFDIYNSYPGVTNLKTVNDAAGTVPVEVSEEIIALLADCRDYCALTGGRMNPAMGSVLQLWHEARTAGLEDPEHACLPNREALEDAAEHTDFANVLLDTENRTVFLADPLQRLDVGAVAKGWSAQRVCELLPEGYLLNLGGNIVASGPKPGNTPWSIGIQSPEDPASYLCSVPLAKGSAVTSGDYQRCYTVDGVSYHHIIDPDTLMPARLWRSVTVLCPDSGLGDCLSTALFLMPHSEGLALAEKCNAQVMWVDAEGNILTTEAFGK